MIAFARRMQSSLTRRFTYCTCNGLGRFHCTIPDSPQCLDRQTSGHTQTLHASPDYWIVHQLALVLNTANQVELVSAGIRVSLQGVKGCNVREQGKGEIYSSKSERRISQLTGPPKLFAQLGPPAERTGWHTAPFCCVMMVISAYNSPSPLRELINCWRHSTFSQVPSF
jgi:hypothetical protein